MLSGITSPFSTLAKSSAARGRLDFFLRNKFLYYFKQFVIYFHQWGWRIPFGPDDFPGHIEFGESPPNYLFLKNLLAGRMYFCLLLYQQQLTIMRIEPSVTWTLGSTLLDPGVPSCKWTRRINSASDNSATSFQDNLFWRPSYFSPTANRTTHYGWIFHSWSIV